MTNTNAREALIDWWLARVWPDLAVAAAFVGAHVAAVHIGWVLFSPDDVSPDRRGLIYVALSTVTALAAGTNNTAVGSYVSSAGAVVDKIRVSHGGTIRLSLRSVGTWLWVVAVVSLVCLALDPQDRNDPSLTYGAAWVAEGLIILAVVKFVRLTLIQDLLLAANDLSRQQETRPQRRSFKRPPKPPSRQT